MTRLPALSASQLVAALKRAGYEEARQSGSHLTLVHSNRGTVIVPIHTGTLHRGLMLRIIKQAGFTQDEFRALL